MHYPKLFRLLLPLSAAASGILLFSGTASAEVTDTAAVPVATGVPAATAVPVATDTAPEINIPETDPVSPKEGDWMDSAEGRKYCYDDGSFAIDVQIIDGIPYLFQKDGTLLTGWQNFDGAWHYYDPQTYQAAVGVQEIDESIYLFDYTGTEKTGWRTVNGIRRYYDPETGQLCSGWFTYAGNRYYIDPETGKVTGEFTLNGVKYLFDSKYGTQKTGFCTFSDKTVSYYETDGSPLSGWLEQSGKKYYFNNNYVMQTGWQVIDQNKYHFAPDGTMQKSWQTIDGNRYYFLGTGIMQTGWLTLSTGDYYFLSDGTMATGTQIIDGKKYLFQENGTLKRIRVCLDAGHYGKYNRSPVNGAYYESDMSWNLHLKLKAALESYGIEVVTTRPTQAGDLGLEERGKKAAGCDLFLSLHSNACNSSSIDAPLACCTVTGAGDVLGQKLADTVHQVMGTYQAGTIWKRVGEHGDYYGVLRGATSVGVPAILLEHSYHTNPRATNWLLNNANLQRMAQAEAAVIATYFGVL